LDIKGRLDNLPNLLWEPLAKLKVITEPYNRLQEKNVPR